MKLLVATHYFESHRGGIEIVAGRLARELSASGLSVTWLATDATPAPATDAGCGRSCPIPAWNMTEQKLGVPLPIPGPRGLAAIWREVGRADAVLLHDSLYPSNVAAMIAARVLRKPVVITQHIAAVPYSSPLLRALMAAGNALVTRPMLRAADQVVFISETVAQHFASLSLRAPARLIFNGVDTALYRPPAAGFDRGAARERLGLPQDGAVALFVGRFVEKKGLHLIERMARLSPGVIFALAGWGPIDPARWGLANVRVLSGLSGAALVPLYQASDALVLPSTGEGWPLVIQEALACGLPVLCGVETASAHPAAAPFVHGVPIGGDHEATAHAFAARLAALLAEPPTAQASEERCAFARAHYSWPAAAAAYRAVLERLVVCDNAGAARREATS